MRAGGRVLGVALLLGAALTACGEQPTLSVADEAPGTSASPTVRVEPSASPATGSSGGPASEPEPSADPSEDPTAPTAPATAAPSPASGGPDLDGDGRGDQVTLTPVPDMGWSFDVRLADGRETSAPLPDDEVVAEDVAVLGGVDLDRDGAHEVLVRSLRAVGGENAVVFRLDGDGVWLVRTDEGVPWELSTSGGMTGPRSYACTGGEVLTRESERQDDGTYRAMTWRWTLDGHVAGPLGGQRDDVLPADEVSLDPSTCRV